jgi:hypothetical protein
MGTNTVLCRYLTVFLTSLGNRTGQVENYRLQTSESANGGEWSQITLGGQKESLEVAFG